MSSHSDSAADKSSNSIDLHRVRRLFESPARITESEFLRREIARRMQERLTLIKIKPERVVDLGCGAGSDLPLLQEYYADAQVIGVDASLPLLRVARDRQRSAMSSMNRLLSKLLPGRIGGGLDAGSALICADFGQLPFKNSVTDLIWSNLALHWHPQPDRVFVEWHRILRVDGLLMFSCFGPDTFKELRSAFAAAGHDSSALSFVDMHDFGDMLVNTGFSTPVMDMETITVTYESVAKLVADVRAWGGNPLVDRKRGLFGRQAWNAVTTALEQNRRSDGKLPLTFEIVYGHAFRPVPTKTSSGEAIIRLDFRKR